MTNKKTEEKTVELQDEQLDDVSGGGLKLNPNLKLKSSPTNKRKLKLSPDFKRALKPKLSPNAKRI